MLARIDPTLDRPVILFQDVIEILHGAVLAVVGQIARGLKHGNGGWISGVFVAADDPRFRMVLTAQGFSQKALSRCCIAFSREKEVDRRTAGVHRPVQVKYIHLPFTRTYVSSTRHELFVGLRCRRKRPSSSGAYRWTHLQTVT
jgi:hypothetical protein